MFNIKNIFLSKRNGMIIDFVLSFFFIAIFAYFMNEKNLYGFFFAPFTVFFFASWMFKLFKIGASNRYNYYRSIGDYYTIRKLDELGFQYLLDEEGDEKK